MRYLALLVVFATSLLAAPPAVEIPSEDLKPVNGYVLMTPKGDAKAFTYVSLSGVYPLPSALLADKRAFVLPVAGLAAGKYEFVAVGSANDEHTMRPFVIEIGGNENGGDDANPPAPKPKPDGSKVDPALLKSLQTAYDADGGNAAGKLAGVMKKGAEYAKNTTRGTDLIAAVTKDRKDAIGEQLPALRKAIGDYINGILPTDPGAEYTADDRKRAVAAYTAVTAALGSLK